MFAPMKVTNKNLNTRKTRIITATPNKVSDKFEISFGLGQRKQMKLLKKIAEQNNDFAKSQAYWANYGVESTYRLGCEIERMLAVTQNITKKFTRYELQRFDFIVKAFKSVKNKKINYKNIQKAYEKYARLWYVLWG